MPEDIIKKLQRIAKENPNKANQQATSLKGKTDYSGLGAGEGKFGTKAIPKYYEKIGSKLGWNPFSLPEDMEKEAYLNQGGGEVLANTIAGFGTQALAGVIGSVAAYDMKGLYDMSVGNTEQQYGNWLNEIGKNIREYSDENFQIYQDGDSMWNTSYWAKQAQSLGYTGGIIAETIAEQVALAYLTGGTGNGLGLASKARLMKTAGQGMFGMFKGIQEGYMNALETQGNVYQKYKELGYDEAEAQKKANKAATLGFRAEVGPLAALNALQFMTTFGVAKSAFSRGAGPNLGFSGGVETLIDRALPSITNKYGKAAVGFGVNALSEGVEEGIQTGVSKYAQHETLKSTGNASGDLDIWDKEMRDSVIGGVLGGGLFAGAGKLLNKYTQGTAAKQYSKAHDSFLSDAVSRTSNTFENQQKVQQEYNEASKAYNENKSKANLSRLERASQMVKEAQYNSHLTNTVNALQLDYVNGKTTAFETHIEQMQTLLDAANEGDIETLKKYNILGQDNKEKFEGAIDTIKNTFEQNIKDSHLIKEKLENNLLNVTSDFESAFDITKKEYLNTKKLDNVSEYATALNTMYSKDTQFNQLSSEGKRRFQLEAELESFNRLDKLSDLDLQRKQEIQTELEGLEDYKANDKRVVDSINKMPYVSTYVSIASTNQSIEDTNTELSKLRDINNIREKVKERTKKKVEKAKSKEDVEDIVAEAKEILSKEEAKKIEDIAKDKEIEIASGAKPVEKEVVQEKEVQTESTENYEKRLSSFLSSPLPEGITEADIVDQTFSPIQVTRKPDAGLIQSLNNLVEDLKTRKRIASPTFRDLVRHMIATTGLENVDRKFNGMAASWEASGREFDEDINDVYQRFFNTAEDFSNNIENILSPTSEESTEITSKIEVKVNKDSSGFAKYNLVEDTYEAEASIDVMDSRTNNPNLKFAYNFTSSKRNSTGEWVRTSRNLKPIKDSDVVNNHYILDKEFLRHIQENEPNGLVARVLDIDTISVGENMTWGELKQKNKDKDSTWYKENVPMGIAYEGELSNGEPVYLAMVHNVTWYSPINILEQSLEKGRENVRNLREQVLQSDNTKGLPITLDHIGFGTVDKLDSGTKPITINESTGDTTLGLFKFVKKTKEYKLFVGTKEFDKGSVKGLEYLIEKLEKAEKQNFYVVHINKIGVDKNGNPMYMAFPTMLDSPIAEQDNLKKDLNPKVVNNLKYVTLASIILNNLNNSYLLEEIEKTYNFTKVEAENIANTVREDLNIDLINGLREYYQNFINTKVSTEEDITKFKLEEELKKDYIKNGLTYLLGHSHNNAIEFGIKNSKTIQFGGRIMNNSKTLSDEQVVQSLLKNFDRVFNSDSGLIKRTQLNYDSSRVDNERYNTITFIGDKGVVTNEKTSYDNFLKDNFKTNVLSHEIETIDGRKEWITDVQPMLYYSTNTKKENEKNKQPTSLDKKVAQATNDALKSITKEDIASEFARLEEQLIKNGANSKQIELARAAFNAKNNIFDSRVNFDSQSLSKQNTNKIGALTDAEQLDVVNALKHFIISNIDFNGNIKQQILDGIESSTEKLIAPLLEEQKGLLQVWETIPGSEDMIQQTNLQIHKLETILNEKSKLTNTVSSETTPLGALITEFNALLNSNFEEDAIEDLDQEENFSKSFLEKDLKLSFSSQLRLSLFGFTEKNKNNQVKINSLGVERYVSADEIYLKLMDITTVIPSSWDMLINSLSNKATETKSSLYNDLKHKLEALPQHIKNELLHKTITKKFTAYKVLNSPQKPIKTKDGEYIIPGSNITVLEESLTNNKMLRESIKKEFISGEFSTPSSEGVLVLNKIYASNVLVELNKVIAEKEKNVNKLKELFNKINLGPISKNTIKFILDTHGDQMFEKGGLLQTISFNLSKLVKEPKEVVLEDNNFFGNIGTQLNEFTNVEVMLNGTSVLSSVRIGDKTLQGVIANTSLHDINQRLCTGEYEKIVEQYLQTPQLANNTTLHLLLKSDKFRRAFNQIGFSSPEAYKLHGKKNFNEGDIDKLALQDILATKLGIYTNTKSILKIEDSVAKDLENQYGLSFRIGQMASHTLSDKGRIMFLTGALLDLKGTEVFFNDAGKINLSKNLSEYLIEQTFTQELERIKQSYQRKSNFSAEELASKVFHYIPSMNAISIDVDGVNLKIHDYLYNRLASNLELEDDKIQKFKEEATKKVLDYINSEVDRKITNDETSGELIELGFYDKSQERLSHNLSPLVNIDDIYLKNKRRATDVQTARFIMTEYVVNNLLHNMNTHALYLGDISFYSKDKVIPTIKLSNNEVKINSEEIAKPENYVKMEEVIGSSLDKRTASLIAPGLKLADSENANSIFPQHFIHVAVNDVISKSKYLKDIKEYQEITGTDAQEYTTWRTHLDMLYRQGSKITQEQYETLNRKLGNNEELNEKEQEILFQPVKPVYTNLVYDGETNLMRPVYNKSSSFPLLPQLTKNLNLDNARKKLEKLENYNKETGSFTPVRMSYQTANKIGSVKTKLTMDMLYSEEDILEEVLKTATSVLPFSGFKIQQENPSKEEKFFHKGKDSRISMGSQFMKIILGNFINHGTAEIFPNKFSEDILKMAGVKVKENLSGQDLDKIYKEVYFKYADSLKNSLEKEIGIKDTPFEELTTEEKNNIIDNLQKIIKKEVVERGYPNYLTKTVELIENEQKELEMVTPLFFDTNTHKFEALLQSLIASRLILHKLPGNGHIVGSSEGFTKKTSLDKLTGAEKQGIIWINGYQEDLKPTYIITKDGRKILSKSQVLIKSHFKYTDANGEYKYVDLSQEYNPETGEGYVENILNEQGDIVGKKLVTDKIDPELLEQFSFRIPTSSHQSGAIIEVAGFLPNNMQDLIVVPAEHTVQLGEDYDIDKRYLYKSNYYVNSKGEIKKLNYDSEIKEYINQVNDVLKNTTSTEENLIDVISNSNLSDVVEEVRQELLDLGLKQNKDGLILTSKKILDKLEQKMLENAMIDIYKSVYSTTDNAIQESINKPLVTDTAERTAFLMYDLLQASSLNPNFSVMSDSYQTELIKIGADGKGGIANHSNAVTLEAQMQRLDPNNKILLGDYIPASLIAKPIWQPFTFNLDGQNFNAKLGYAIKTLEGSRDVAEQHGENQNVSTDNINKGIMGKRNENSHTMNVFALLAHMRYDLSSGEIETGLGYKGKMHLPSLLLNQPILRDYVKVMEKYNSITSTFMSQKDKENKIIIELGLKYGFIHASELTEDFIPEQPKDIDIKDVTGQTLWDNLKEEQAKKYPDLQQKILYNFLNLSKQARQLSKIQQLFNISSSKLGVSYFEVLNKINTLDELASTYITATSDIKKGLVSGYNNFDKFIGEVETKEKEGYTKVGKYYWKPTTVEGKMLINSLAVANNVMPIFFPYDSTTLSSIMYKLFNNVEKSMFEKSNANLKWKYEIMSAFKDFINSGVGVSVESLEKERQRIFFDNEVSGRMSLGTILKDLNKKNNPIMSNKLLKELDIQKDKLNDLVTILHTANDNSTIDKSTKYDAFLDLLKDETELGEYNGETLTVSKLAQDLVTYSFLTDNQNGATGFKNFVNVEYLNTIGVNENYRDIFKLIASDKTSLTMIDRFVEQYLQHYPERAKTMTLLDKNKYEKTLKEENILPIQYISIKNNDKDTTNTKYDLYKYDEATGKYIEIPILGTTAYNEYDSSRDSNYSLINSIDKIRKEGQIFMEKGNKYITLKIGSKLEAKDVDMYRRVLEGEDWNTVEKVLSKLLNSPTTSTEYKQFIEQILPFVDKNIRLEWKPNAFNSFILTDSGEGVIMLDSNMYSNLLDKYNNNFNKVQEKFREIVFEEVLHSISVREIKQYLKFSDNETGDFELKEDAPLFMQKIATAYDLARNSVPYNPNDLSTYYSKNIYEFMAGMYVSEDYKQNLENKNSGFIQRFLEAIRDMLKYLKTQLTGEQVTYKDEIFSAVKELLETNKNKFGNKGVEKINNIDFSKDISMTLTEIKNDNPVVLTDSVERPLDIKEKTKNTMSLGDALSSGLLSSGDILESRENLKTQYQKNQGVSNEGKIVSEKVIRDLGTRLSDRIGIPVSFISDRSADFKGKLEGDKAVINLAHATLDTPIHEILGHPIIRAIKGKHIGSSIEDYNAINYFWEENPHIPEEDVEKEYVKSLRESTLYGNLLKELEYGKGKEVLDRIKKDYVFKNSEYQKIKDENFYFSKNLYSFSLRNEVYEYEVVNIDTFNTYTIYVKNNKGISFEEFKKAYNENIENLKTPYTLEEQQEEAIVELLGLMTANRLDKVKDGKLISLLKRLLKEIKTFMKTLFRQKEVEIDKLPDNMTLGDLADLLAYSNSKLILPGNEVIYTTPDNQQFKTYVEASKHISNLVKNIKDIDLNSIKIKPKLTSVDQIPVNKFSTAIEDFIKINEKWYYGYNENKDYSKLKPIDERVVLEEYNNKELELIANEDTGEFTVLDNTLNSFIEANKQYEQSKDIVEEWKKINNIQYNPEEVYSRGQEFVSVVGAYSDFDINLMMQNLLHHIEDNEKAGGKFAISAFTKSVDKKIGHLEGGGSKIKFKIYPKSDDILWAANTDVYSGSVWDASTKVNKDKKSELLGVSYTKYPSLENINAVQPNLASIVDNLNHHHNELGIVLTGNNFRLEYDKDIPFQTKKIINSINSILDEKYGKINKPNIKKNAGEVKYVFLNETFDNLEDAKKVVDLIADEEANEILGFSYDDIEKRIIFSGIQPTQTEETLKQSINSIKNKKEDKEYTSQALINTKIAKLKEQAKKYPRSLIRSEITKKYEDFSDDYSLFEEDELPFQKVSSTEREEKFKLPEIHKCK